MFGGTRSRRLGAPENGPPAYGILARRPRWLSFSDRSAGSAFGAVASADPMVLCERVSANGIYASFRGLGCCRRAPEMGAKCPQTRVGCCIFKNRVDKP